MQMSLRMLGIGIAAFGLLLFPRIVGDSLRLVSRMLFSLLILTDMSVLLSTRFDYAPEPGVLDTSLMACYLCAELHFYKTKHPQQQQL